MDSFVTVAIPFLLWKLLAEIDSTGDASAGVDVLWDLLCVDDKGELLSPAVMWHILGEVERGPVWDMLDM